MSRLPSADVHQELQKLVDLFGIIKKFGDLPFACRCAYAFYQGQVVESLDGYDPWKFPSYLETLKKLPDRADGSAWMRGFKRHVRKVLSRTHKDLLVGHMHLPLDLIADGITSAVSPTYDEYHRQCLVNTGYIPKYPHQDMEMRWPVILADEHSTPPLLDGHHRFSRYYQLGYHKTPALFFVKQ